MTKPALFYAIKNPHWGTTRVVAVTSIKRTYHWYGRELPDNMATHGNMRDLYGRFETAEDAEIKIAQLQDIRAKHAPIIAKHEKRASAARAAERAEIDASLPRVQPFARLKIDVPN